MNKVNELDGKVDIVFVDGKIAADISAMLIIKVKRINSNIKIVVLGKDKTSFLAISQYALLHIGHSLDLSRSLEAQISHL